MATMKTIDNQLYDGDVTNYCMTQNSSKLFESKANCKSSASPRLMNLETKGNETKEMSNNVVQRNGLIDKNRPHNEHDLAKIFIGKIQNLRSILEFDLMGCDAKWLLFVSAALSYRYDTNLKPFPPRYLTVENTCNMDALVNVINDTPSLRLILQNIIEKNYDSLDIEVLELLHWVLIEIKEPIMRLISLKDTKKVVRSIDGKAKFNGTVNMFEVNAQSGPHSELAFRRVAADRPVRLAFFGCKLDNFFALLNNGFHLYFSDDKPIELSTNLKTSLKNSPVGAGWGAAQCGAMLSCTALCEVALNLDYVQIENNADDKKSQDFKIMSPDYVRIRYIVLCGPHLPANRDKKFAGFFNIFQRYKQCVSLGFYVLIFISIGVINHSKASTLRAYIFENLQSVLNFCSRILVPNK